ncbi:MAG: hypothetical protein KDK36_15435 [Leptospiraceae bacterium]|nr:hypothetical protein [Leptospiraceae bacterium]
MQSGWKKIAEKTGLNIQVTGVPVLSYLSFNVDNKLAVETLFIKLMLEKGFLAHFSFYPCAAHTEEHLNLYFEAAEEVFSICKKANDENTVEKLLDGPVRQTDFRRLS